MYYVFILDILFITVISTRLASYLGEKGYSFLPSDAVNYTTCLVNQILSRRRQHLERRNDFIQMMVDHEEEIKHQEQSSKTIDKQEQEGTLRKSINMFLLLLFKLVILRF
jgi:hypothetical protein